MVTGPYTRLDAVLALQAMTRRLGHAPGKGEYDRERWRVSAPSALTVLSQLGVTTWAEALRQAGVN